MNTRCIYIFELLIIRVSGVQQHGVDSVLGAQCTLCSVDVVQTLRTPTDKMADGVDIDLYADDIEQDFAQVLCIYIRTHYDLVVYV
jgi:hypothetical protein